MSNYLLEILHEEIPASFVDIAHTHIKSSFEKIFDSRNINYTSFSSGTPRRILLMLNNIDELEKDSEVEVMGPPVNLVYTDGVLNDVGKKFAISKGINVEDIRKVSTPKGEYIVATKKIVGLKTRDIIAEKIEEVIRTIPFPKSMKWGSLDYKFARPIHNILSIYDNEILDFEIASIKTSRNTYGHRFMAPAKIEIKGSEYLDKLREAFVIVDSDLRASKVDSSIRSLAGKSNLDIKDSDDLIKTVTNLVEFPHAVLGTFDEKFLTLPEEVLVTSMKVHQKFFPLFDKNGKIVNKFIGVSNAMPKDDTLIRQGYERVLRARLTDALFFYNNDKSKNLLDMTESLKAVTYQVKLGSAYAKVERFKKIAKVLSAQYAKDKSEDIDTICMLAKADLMSEMVYEFPELQGIMGYYYAKNAGYKDNIAISIKEHYQPRSANDALPSIVESRIVSIADKVDTIAGIFCIDMNPTGNLDPYALRRSAIGILNIILDAKIDISLSWLISVAVDNFDYLHTDKSKFDKPKYCKLILDFFMQRLKQIFSSNNINAEIFDAVTDKGFDNPIKLFNLAKLLTDVRETDNFITIAKSYKRINNILKKNNAELSKLDRKLLISDEEVALLKLIDNEKINEYISKEMYNNAIEELMGFAIPINKFFDNVMVIVDDEKLKDSRLAMLLKLREIFSSFANLEMVAVG